jgi:hypothetical protein
VRRWELKGLLLQNVVTLSEQVEKERSHGAPRWLNRLSLFRTNFRIAPSKGDGCGTIYFCNIPEPSSCRSNIPRSCSLAKRTCWVPLKRKANRFLKRRQQMCDGAAAGDPCRSGPKISRPPRLRSPTYPIAGRPLGQRFFSVVSNPPGLTQN